MISNENALRHHSPSITTRFTSGWRPCWQKRRLLKLSNDTEHANDTENANETENANNTEKANNTENANDSENAKNTENTSDAENAKTPRTPTTPRIFYLQKWHREHQ